jgi:hypothetical protein
MGAAWVRDLLVRRIGTDRWVLVGVFVISRLLYGLAGVRFDASGLDYSSQLLGQDLLRDRLVESVWYLHAQPPAFNLGVGLVLKLSPFDEALSFHLVFLVFGLALLLGVHDLGRLLGLGRVTAMVAAAVVCVAPATVLHENWLSYEYPVATMLVLLVDASVRYAKRGGGLALAAAVGLATLAVLTRSLLHPVWLVAVIAVLLLYRRPPRRWLIAAVAVPLVLVGGVLLKNTALFGSPQLSSWLGYNVHKVAIEPLTEAQRQQLIDEGVLTFEAEPPCQVSRPDVPALAEAFKETPAEDALGEPVNNFNYECVIDEYEGLLANATATARAHPDWVAKNVGGSFEIWATPSTLSPFVFENRTHVEGVDELVRRTLLLDVAWDPPIAIPAAWPVLVSAPDQRFHLSLTLVAATAIAVAGAVAAAVTWRRRTPARFGVLVGGATVAYVTLVGNLLEYGENNRIRFIVEPLTLILALAVVVAVVRRLRARRAASRPVDRAGAAERPEEAEVALANGVSHNG